jgi:hypothetical protein
MPQFLTFTASPVDTQAAVDEADVQDPELALERRRWIGRKVIVPLSGGRKNLGKVICVGRRGGDAVLVLYPDEARKVLSTLAMRGEEFYAIVDSRDASGELVREWCRLIDLRSAEPDLDSSIAKARAWAR